MIATASETQWMDALNKAYTEPRSLYQAMHLVPEQTKRRELAQQVRESRRALRGKYGPDLQSYARGVVVGMSRALLCDIRTDRQINRILFGWPV